MELENRICFTGRLCPSRLKSLTSQAQLGISLEQKSNLNYYYALPNKLFNYIQSGVPVLCSDFPEMKRVVEEFNVGMTVNPSNTMDLKEKILQALTDQEKIKIWQDNCKIASEVLNWKNEEKELICLFREFGMKFKNYNDD